MPQRHFKSIEEWRRDEGARRRKAASRQLTPRSPSSPAGGRLCVEADVAPHADPSAMRECRAIVLDWLQERMGGKLPRRAFRHGSFSRGGEEAACRAVRVRDVRRDCWAAQLERRPGAGRTIVTEVVVGREAGGGATVGIDVVDRSVAPGDCVAEYPAEMLAAMGERVPLLQRGRTLSRAPIVVDSPEAMHGFHRMLVDPRRETPFAVVSVPPDTEDLESLRSQWRALAGALTGLAIVWVLQPAMTYRLSDLVGKPLSVFLGAWRFYRPGFDHRAARNDHPLFLRNRMGDARAVAEVTRQCLSLAARERMRRGTDTGLAFDYQTLVREASGAVRGPARLVAFLKGSLPGRRVQRFEYAATPGTESASGGRLLTDRPRGRNETAPAVVREPASGALRQTVRDETPLLRRKLRAATEKARTRASRYERAKRRADAAERERDAAHLRARQLEGLVRSLGGNPDAEIPFPTTWEEVASWCEQNLASRLTLAAPARRELGGADFEDVSLAARCLNWLAFDYRDTRLRGGDPQLHGRIDDIADGVFNLPCGGDSFECSWEGRNHRVEWHIKRGANTRDPRRCLRIYYFWDQANRQVVVASMPAHRRSAAT